MIIITSKKAGFRRCGIAHPVEPTEYPDGTFTPEQIEALHAEPMLVVREACESKAELTDKPTSAADMIALIRKTTTLEELHKLSEGETRKTVIDAVAARWKELEE